MKNIFVCSILCAALAAVADFRPPCVPLVNVDPHFSLWSAADRLFEKDTSFWTGWSQPFTLVLEADGVAYRLCGRDNGHHEKHLPVLKQKRLRVGATTTTYVFVGPNDLKVEVEFMTPRLTDDLDVFSRPVGYVTVAVTGANEWKVTADISNAFATNDNQAEMVRENLTIAGLPAIKVGRKEQAVFSTKGDGRRPNWGYAYLLGPSTKYRKVHFLLAYDDILAFRYFGRDLPDWWRRNGKTFEEMLTEAERDFVALRKKCHAFDRQLAKDLVAVGGKDYADIAALAWRQSYGACRLAAYTKDEPFFMSNENFSGGMIGTTDVFYPQMPHLLLTSLPLVKATLAPTMIYASSTNWPYAYAPHDLGLFPVAEGQYYGMKKGQAIGGNDDDSSRMPVEECGNMLISLGALSKAEGNADFASRWWPTVTSWANYLEKVGFDPENQLCTDDFAGHLAHNANLSIKTVMALASYALMAGLRGEKDIAAKYRKLAADMVPRWLEAAKGGAAGGYRLAFDRPGSWSQKYNLIWDTLLGFNLFPKDVARAELAAYRTLATKYGLPLDNRKPYTKADWIVWCGALTGEKDDLEFMCKGLHEFLDDSADRVPFCDWYATDSALKSGFQARSVVGGVFLPMLFHEDLVKTYRHN